MQGSFPTVLSRRWTDAGPGTRDPWVTAPTGEADTGGRIVLAQHRYEPVVEPGFGAEPSSVGHWVLPTGRSWQAISAGYVALLAVVLWPLGPVALFLGIWALVRASRHGGHGRGRAVFAVVVGAITSLIMLAILATSISHV